MKLRAVALICGLLGIGMSAFGQGAVSGGGGRAVVCRNTDGTIKSAELLDLYEAREIFGLTLNLKNRSLERELSVAFCIEYELNFRYDRKQCEAFVDKGTAVDTLSLKHIKFIQYPNELQSVQDSDEPIVPAGCKTEQLGNYYVNQVLLVQKEIWDKLDNSNKAAFVLHENIYKTRREKYADDRSTFTRRWVGQQYSTKPIPSVVEQMDMHAKEFAATHKTEKYSIYNCSEPFQGNRIESWYNPGYSFDVISVKNPQAWDGYTAKFFFYQTNYRRKGPLFLVRPQASQYGDGRVGKVDRWLESDEKYFRVDAADQFGETMEVHLTTRPDITSIPSNGWGSKQWAIDMSIPLSKDPSVHRLYCEKISKD